ncbi:MAG: hypothetical protein JW838_09740 [Spirochaetes bacterium]|nr:hypothetical protein [Spirochaetota bacterium]
MIGISFKKSLLCAILLLVPGNISAPVEETVSVHTFPMRDTRPFFEESPSGNVIYDIMLESMYTAPGAISGNYIVAYYGHPKSRIMGIVGRHPKEELAGMVKKTASDYASLKPQRGALPAFYLIYGTCQPKGEINLMKREMVEAYIRYAYANGILVYLDHQIGRYSVEHAMDQLLPFLHYPNVHLALDPEWRTTRPMREIGSIDARELNEAQRRMRDYMVAHGIRGRRHLVIHQFHAKMIRNRSRVRSDYDPVILVHATSGWGTPERKSATHERNALAANMPHKGFKLWYYCSDKKGVHYDNPLMTPSQVVGLRPEPGLIIYQ